VKLYLAALFVSSILLAGGTVLLGGHKVVVAQESVPQVQVEITRPPIRVKTLNKSMFVTKWDSISPGYHEVTGLFFDGISDRNGLSSEPRYGPTFSFTVEGAAYANLEPIGIMPVQYASDPERSFQVEILVQRKKDGHNGFILRVPETTEWIKTIQEAAPNYILSGR